MVRVVKTEEIVQNVKEILKKIKKYEKFLDFFMEIPL